MKKILTYALVLIAVSGFFNQVRAQDTLHLDYHHTQIPPADSTLVRIDKWVASLKGVHQDIKVIAYFHRPEFKKFAQQRCDEMFLTLNRKARSLITIEFIGPRKGEDYQRTRVDIIYLATGSAEKVAAAAAAAKVEQEKVKAEEKAKEKEAEKAKAAEKAGAAKAEGKTEDKKKTKTEVVADTQDKDKKSGAADKAAAKEKEKKDKEQEAAEEAAEKSGKYPARRLYSKFSINEEELALVKSSRIILTTSSASKANDALLRDAMKNFWTFNSNVSTLPYDSASNLAKKDKTILLMFITKIVTKSVTHSSGNYTIARGRAVVIEKGKKKMVYSMFFPEAEEDPSVRPEFVNFAVSALNSLLVNMDAQGLKKIRTMNTPFEKNSAELQNRTLLIPDFLLSKKVTPTEISTIYHAKYEVVDYGTFADAINQKKKYAYVLPVPFSTGGKILIYDYLMDAETGQVYYVLKPSAFGAPKIAGPLGTVHDLGHSERISAKNIEKYNKAFEKKGDKDEPEEEIKDETEKSEDGAAEKKETEKPKTESKEKPKTEKKAKSEPK